MFLKDVGVGVDLSRIAVDEFVGDVMVELGHRNRIALSINKSPLMFFACIPKQGLVLLKSKSSESLNGRHDVGLSFIMFWVIVVYKRYNMLWSIF